MLIVGKSAQHNRCPFFPGFQQREDRITAQERNNIFVFFLIFSNNYDGQVHRRNFSMPLHLTTPQLEHKKTIDETSSTTQTDCNTSKQQVIRNTPTSPAYDHNTHKKVHTRALAQKVHKNFLQQKTARIFSPRNAHRQSEVNTLTWYTTYNLASPATHDQIIPAGILSLQKKKKMYEFDFASFQTIDTEDSATKELESKSTNDNRII